MNLVLWMEGGSWSLANKLSNFCWHKGMSHMTGNCFSLVRKCGSSIWLNQDD